MFYTEEYIIDGFDVYGEYNVPLGGYFDQLKLVITYGKRLITYELWLGDRHESLTWKFKNIWSTDELDLMLQYLMDKMFDESRHYGCDAYYDIDLIAA